MENYSISETTLYQHEIDTPIGTMIILADDLYIYLLDFIQRKSLQQNIIKVKNQMSARIVKKKKLIHQQIENELVDYFTQKITNFKTPIKLIGTKFQVRVWQALQEIPLGTTWSYGDLATYINQDKAYRAVAMANSMNRIALIIPCHRVINSNGSLGGYAGGVERKQWLLDHEHIAK